MSIPDGAEYWWDVKGYGSCYGGSKGRTRTPEQKAAYELRRQVRDACECARCGHSLSRHGRFRIPGVKSSKRRHGGQCNHNRDGDRLGCGCSGFRPKKEDADTAGKYLVGDL
jgi:hypothetical protein